MIYFYNCAFCNLTRLGKNNLVKLHNYMYTNNNKKPLHNIGKTKKTKILQIYA